MCGIFGTFGLIDSNLLNKALNIMINRGPDSKGIFIDKYAMLGIRRLSIIDLKTGKQPIFNEDKSIVTIFNGEIYNYKELRFELEKKGHHFYTDTDTETIVHAYEEYGELFVQRLNGMFAIALYDMNVHKILIYRDRYGEKPLYYYNQDIFIFSSEIAPILQYEEIKPRFNVEELPHYLKYRYFRNPSTFIRQIKKMVPGTYITITKRGIEEKKYYEHNNINETSDLGSLLYDSIILRLRSDVPIGLFLSGGLDSTTILHYMNKANKKIRTYSIGFEGYDETNELKYARSMSDTYGTNHNEITVSCQQAIKILDKALMKMEEPVSDPTTISSYFLSEKASKKVKVVMSGEGADEIFGGYNYYKNMKLYKTTKPFKPFLGLLRYFPQKVLDAVFNYPGGIGEEGRQRLIGIENMSEFEIYDHFITLWKDYNSVLREKKSYEPRERSINRSIFAEMFQNDISGWLPDFVLARVDKMSMANSIECRSPFLDNRIVDYFGGKDIDKSILRKEMAHKLPIKVIKRNKFPFFTPIQGWYKEGLREYYDSLFDESDIIRKLFNKKVIDTLINKHDNSPMISSRKLWSLMTLEKSISGLKVQY